jgi:hypothetical protein
VDEATLRIQEAGLQGISPSAVMTEAKRLARNAVKAQWQAQGLKVAHIEHRKLVEAAKAYLDTHRAELVSQAVENLRQRSVRLPPPLRTLSERIERQSEANRS